MKGDLPDTNGRGECFTNLAFVVLIVVAIDHFTVSCLVAWPVPARTIRKNTKLIIAMNYKHECFCKSASSIVESASHKTHLNVVHGGYY